MKEQALRVELCQAGHTLWQRGLIGAAEGNLSARLDGATLLCTPAGACKGLVQPEELVLIHMEDPAPGSKGASSEIGLHLSIYRALPDCSAVVHAHPVVATGFALAGTGVDARLLPEGAILLGDVPVAPFATPGTPALGQSVLPFLRGRGGLLLANHGAVTWGTSVQVATDRMETLERIARMTLVATLLGGARALPEDALAALGGVLGRFP